MANTTWSTTDKTSGITLSGGNLTAAWGGSGTQNIRSADRQVSGKYYWELIPAGTLSNHAVGVANAGTLANFSATNSATSVGAVWVNNTGTVHSDGTLVGGVTGALAAGTAVCIALDLNAGLVWFRNSPAANWNGSATANPATGAGGLVTPFKGLFAAYPIVLWTGGAAGASETANFGDTAFTGTVPSGFTSGFPSPSPTVLAFAGGVAREALVADTGQARLGGLVREALVAGTVTYVLPPQHAVTVIT